jgi:filamentous hemagglutinin family protein
VPRPPPRVVLATLAWASLSAYGQVLPDATLATAVTRSGHAITIGGGTRTGANLFQSFLQFDLARGDVATFTSPAGVLRIIGRVTGDAPSHIEGTLSAPGSLYLINPHGWVFGAGAALDVRGAFAVSGADYVKLGTSGEFHATQPERTVLGSAAPTAFGFLGPTGGTIAVNGSQLTARPGGQLWFSGSELRLSGASLVAAGGRIELESLGSLEASNTLIAADSAGTGRASGSISIRAGHLVLADASSVQSVNSAAGAGGAIVVQSVGDVVVDNSALSTRTAGSGDGGPLSIDAASVSLQNGAQIDTATFGSGTGGALSITAGGTVHISGQASGLLSFALASGDAGTIRVRATSLEMDGGAISARTYAAGNAGAVDIGVETLRLANVAQIDATTLGHGRGGDLRLVASREIAISGQDALNPEFRSGLFASAELDPVFTIGPADGDAGTIRVQTPSLVVSDGGFISGGSFGPATGQGGSVVIDAARIALNSGGEIGSKSAGGGPAGSLRIATTSLELRGGIISTQADTAGGGDISISARDLVYLKDSAITTSVAGGTGNGGNITIDPQFVVLDNSQIIANAFGGNGGNISIVADNFLNQNGLVQASSQLGVSGNVTIQSPRVDVTGALRTLSADYLDAARLIRDSCAARSQRASNTFRAGVRGGLAAAPKSGQELAQRGPVAIGCLPFEGMAPVLDAPAAGDHHVANQVGGS